MHSECDDPCERQEPREKRSDYRHKAFVCLHKACDILDDYSLGDILYASLRSIAKRNGQSVAFLRGMTDKELFDEIDYNIFVETVDEVKKDIKFGKDRKKKKNNPENEDKVE